MADGIAFNREFAMPSPETFSLSPVARLLDRWLEGCAVVVDPFARNSKRGTITNDLNMATVAEHHLHADLFVESLNGTKADAVLFDPPYSPRQVAQCYQQIGLVPGQSDTQTARLYRRVKNGLDRVLKPGGIAICCGWNSVGFGLTRGYVLQEILLVTHGAAHNDTIITVEMKSVSRERGIRVKRKILDGTRTYLVYDARAAFGDTEDATVLDSLSATNDEAAKREALRDWRGTAFVLYGCTFKGGVAVEDVAPLLKHRC